MGNLQSQVLQHGALATLTKAEADRLERRMKKLGRGRAEIARSDLNSLDPEIANNPFVDRLFRLHDRDGDGLLLFDDMRRLMETMSRLRNEELRYKFAFELFDANGDGFIDEEELLRVLASTNHRNLHEDQLRQIVSSTFSRWDCDGCGRLDYRQFRELCASSAELRL